MKRRLILIFFGLAAHLDGYALFQLRSEANLSGLDIDSAVHKRVTREADQSSQTPATEDGSPPEKKSEETKVGARKHLRNDHSRSDKESEESKVDARRHLRNDHLSADPGSKVLAFGLDTGKHATTKNAIVQAIYDAFGALERPHVRARGKGYRAADETKKPLSIEVSSDALLRGLEKFLGSPKVKQIAADLARKAAVIYRAIEKEL